VRTSGKPLNEGFEENYADTGYASALGRSTDLHHFFKNGVLLLLRPITV